VVPVRPRDRPAAQPVLRLLADGAPSPAGDARLRPVLLRGARAAADQVQAGRVPGAVPRAAGGPVSAVGVYRARPDTARTEDGDPLRGLLGAAVRARGVGGVLDAPQGF